MKVNLTTEYVYWLLFVLLLVEGIGVPGIPFEAIFIAAGYFIERGEMSLMGAVLVGTLGNLTGNVIGYWLGARTVPFLLRRFANRSIAKYGGGTLNYWFNKYGAVIVVISRWFGPIRTPTILGASAMGMKLGAYAFYSAIGAFTWTLAWQFATWKGVGIFEKWWRLYRRHTAWWLDMLLVLILVGITSWAISYFYKRYRSHKT